MDAAGKAALCVFMAATAWAWIAGAASAEIPERFTGTLSCAKSAFTKAARREPISIEVSGGVARFRHTVLDEEGTAGVGVETGEGTMGKDGRVTLAGAWKSRAGAYSYEARYSGSLGAKGGEFSGRQVWTVHGRKDERGCTMTLAKRGRSLLPWRR